MSQKLPANEFKWIKDTLSPNFMNLIENFDEESDDECIIEVDAEYPKDLYDLHSNPPFLPERMKINKCNKLCVIYIIKTIMLFI